MKIQHTLSGEVFKVYGARLSDDGKTKLLIFDDKGWVWVCVDSTWWIPYED